MLPTTPSTPLPSFDELLKSIGQESMQTTTSKPRQYPSESPKQLQHNRIHRPMPLPYSALHKAETRPRSISDPTPSPTTPSQHKAQMSPRRPSLPMTRSLSHSHSLSHSGDRIKAIREGDGGSPIDDAIAPELMPVYARPCHSRRNLSTSSLPVRPTPLTPATPPIHSGYQPHTPRPAYQYTSSSISGWNESPISAHAHSMGSHSPLSVNSPLTPRSIQWFFDHQTGSRPSAETKAHTTSRYSQELDLDQIHIGTPRRSEGVAIPCLPKM